MNRHYLLLSCFFLLLLAGCVTQQPAPRHSLLNQPTPTQAKLTRNQKINFPILEMLIKSGDLQVAQSLIKAIDLKTLSAEQRSQLNLLSAQLHSINENPETIQFKQYERNQLFSNQQTPADILQFYFGTKKHDFKLPTSLAIFLPESGRFSQAAAAIKQGFITAYHCSESDFKPSIRFYDSNSDNPVNLYHQAISAGAELVIGPLSKNNIQTLALGTELTIPVLALNHVTGLYRKNLFQFGLSPIDEMTQISNQAYLDGHSKILLISPETTQGHRLVQQLTEYWQTLDGTLLNLQSYDTKKTDFSQPIKNLLNLNESQDRYHKISRLLVKNIKYTPRRRHDVDAIFLATDSQTIHALYPQIRFFQASQVPVYALSNLYSGQPNISLNKDLNKLTFCDIPWLFPDVYLSELTPAFIHSTSPSVPNRYLRLIALGIDAFNIITHLEQLKNTPYSGATGTLSINFENRITRQLVCAKFIHGKPVLQNFSDESLEKTTTEEFFMQQIFSPNEH